MKVLSTTGLTELIYRIKQHVSGTHDGSAWTTLTIGGTTKSIPSGSSPVGHLYRHNILLMEPDGPQNEICFELITPDYGAYSNFNTMFAVMPANKRILATGTTEDFDDKGPIMYVKREGTALNAYYYDFTGPGSYALDIHNYSYMGDDVSLIV